MIFKIQLAIPDRDHCLLYNEDRSIMGQFKPSKSILKFMGEELKKYFVGTFNESTGEVSILKEVAGFPSDAPVKSKRGKEWLN